MVQPEVSSISLIRSRNFCFSVPLPRLIFPSFAFVVESLSCTGVCSSSENIFFTGLAASAFLTPGFNDVSLLSESPSSPLLSLLEIDFLDAICFFSGLLSNPGFSTGFVSTYDEGRVGTFHLAVSSVFILLVGSSVSNLLLLSTGL
ncbi:hypothetical protein V8G54_014522 [Vigna mungo]|uniref:Uncharacterized protein n=1 Tax=Vigna mungo TaxID=3915 RepID=A0AAQ3RXJ1_VIGMU